MKKPEFFIIIAQGAIFLFVDIASHAVVHFKPSFSKVQNLARKLSYSFTKLCLIVHI